ncbi:solute carrier family 45 member 3 isoform X2 [Esox lucius]|uniref:solute carrier family 45 member 3 isoform X2 n=1 Tax=Esox lucius TaxID=8010 RepID=UPI001476A404|nr:solute carrier family 45 member 3 isoform X2 [Esox lucius]
MQGHLYQLLLVNALTCGLEVCMAAGTFYIPPLLLQAGMEERYMTMVMGVGPILGLIFVPIIGSYSDSWRGRFGRRRPFIWLLCVGVLLGLQIMPQASRLAALLCPKHPRWLERILLAGTASLLEFSGQACFTPLEALISDKFPGEEESRRAFSVYSLMISLGGCLGYLLSALDWSHDSTAAYLGGQEAFVYTLLSLIFFTCLLSTIFISEDRWTGGGETTGKVVKVISPLSPSHWRKPQCVHPWLPWPQCVWLVLGRGVSLCLSWPQCVWLVLGRDFMGVGLYRGVPNATAGTQERLRYEKGVRMASLGLFLQCVTSVICSILMERWIVLLGTRAVYVSSLVLLALSTAVMSFSKSVMIVTVMAAATGYTFCVLQVLPYTLLSLYHSNKQVFFPNSTPRTSQNYDRIHSKPPDPANPIHVIGNSYPERVTHSGAAPVLSSTPCHMSLALGKEAVPQPQRGMCLDMAILDSAYLLSQVLPSLCLGSIVEQSHSVSAYMASACSLSLLALLCTTGVIFTHSDLHRLMGSKGNGPTVKG